MTVTRRCLSAATALAAAGAAAGAGVLLLGRARAAELPPPDPLTHTLNRIGFGVSDDDLARARAVGIEAYIDEQLAPESIDDSAVEADLARYFPAVFLTPEELAGLSEEERRQAGFELKLATPVPTLVQPPPAV